MHQTANKTQELLCAYSVYELKHAPMKDVNTSRDPAAAYHPVMSQWDDKSLLTAMCELKQKYPSMDCYLL